MKKLKKLGEVKEVKDECSPRPMFRKQEGIVLSPSFARVELAEQLPLTPLTSLTSSSGNISYEQDYTGIAADRLSGKRQDDTSE